MSDLSPRDSEFVALGAALGSNCVPCIEYHIPQARKAGLTDDEIQAAIQLADKVRQVPARKVLEAARTLLQPAGGNPAAATEKVQGIAAMMPRMMASGCSPAAFAAAPSTERAATAPASGCC